MEVSAVKMMEWESGSQCLSDIQTPTIHSLLSAPSTPSPSTPTRNPTDTCFSCKRQGHWARECPAKTPKTSPGSASSINDVDRLLVRCPCGRGTCTVKTSTTPKNPGRKFYSCPWGGPPAGCDFFKWCDQFVHLKAPMCPCDAGVCSLNRQSNGPDAGRWYFACRIKKNHGACGFFQWAEFHEKGNLSPQSPLVMSSQSSLDLSLVDVHANAKKDEVPSGDLVVQDVEPWDPVMGRALRFSQLVSQCSIRRQQLEFSRKISAAGDTLCGDVICQELFLHVRGWLGTLAFPPSKCLEDPVVPYFGCYGLSNIKGSTLELQAPSNDEPNVLPSQKCGEDTQLSRAQWEPSRRHNACGTVQDDKMSRCILKSFGQGLLDVLQSVSPSDHEIMVKVAEATFETLQRLSVDHGPLSKGVKEYIHYAAKLSGIEGSMRRDISSQELINTFNGEKARFDCASHLHYEAVVAHKAAHDQVKSLREEASRIKELLLQIETKLSFHEAESSELQARFDETSKEMSESERSMEAASQEMEEALNLEQQRDSVLDAAKAALETVRNQILQA